ncbi:MAG: hypothetical protein ACK47N_21505 [Microcystis sp.]|jgi:hypothetical protein|uniref:hypothetical protein n=1 Tax=Microcystis TaxID=1125 RepID=UPI000E36A60E|nr:MULTISPECIES: hypothetical protein [Microcystis]NCQ93309.1 hypothetical protein [Microcystis aeruginosa LG13-13]NCR06455.1 hypothetical protein [Microcystis aeruginosa LG13-03]NCR64663.1 hypothetical protein [Microcystis aeruginosa LG11-05]REJ43880.1 MAG: hypothetical protein DWQ58_23770 [Microcystis aeruginosa TA09]MBD2289316.1 hypothetical protein [Microcystis wesenbergii FACHB-1317]
MTIATWLTIQDIESIVPVVNEGGGWSSAMETNSAIGAIDLFVLCVFVVLSTRYIRLTSQINQEKELKDWQQINWFVYALRGS